MSSWGAIYRNTTFALRSHSDQLAQLQLQAATGARVLRASDDPGDADRILHLQSHSRSVGTYVDNLDSVSLGLQEASNALQEMSSSLARVRTLLTQAASGTLNDTNRCAVAEEINSLLEQVVSLANHKSLGRHLFSGASISVTPYEVEREDGEITAVHYRGSHGDLPVPVAEGVTYSGLFAGDRVFRSDDRQPPVCYGNTGAAAGDGTSSVRGDVWLTLENTSTEYAAGTHGLQAGSGQDAILGRHTLTVSAAAQTIRLDDGTDVGFTGTETDLALTNQFGDVVHVDLTGWSGGDETIAVTGQGRASIDDGESWTALTDFNVDLAVTRASDGRVLRVDTGGILRVGVEPVRVPGTYDLFGTLMDARDLLRNSRDLDVGAQMELIDELIGSTDEVAAGLSETLTIAGGRLQAMDTLRGTLETIQADADVEVALLGDADLVQVATELARAQNLYEMTLASSAKLMSLSLLDYLR